MRPLSRPKKLRQSKIEPDTVALFTTPHENLNFKGLTRLSDQLSYFQSSIPYSVVVIFEVIE